MEWHRPCPEEFCAEWALRRRPEGETAETKTEQEGRMERETGRKGSKMRNDEGCGAANRETEQIRTFGGKKKRWAARI